MHPVVPAPVLDIAPEIPTCPAAQTVFDVTEKVVVKRLNSCSHHGDAPNNPRRTKREQFDRTHARETCIADNAKLRCSKFTSREAKHLTGSSGYLLNPSLRTTNFSIGDIVRDRKSTRLNS